MNETKERSNIEMIRYSQQACCGRYLQDIVEKTLRQYLLFQVHVVGNKIICLHVPITQQTHSFLFHRKRAYMRTSTSFHLYSSLTESVLTPSVLIPVTINDLYTRFPKVNLSTCTLASIPCRFSPFFCTTFSPYVFFLR